MSETTNEDNYKIIKVGEKMKRLTKHELAIVQAGKPEQISVFQEQLINEQKPRTTTLRISSDLVDRTKKMAKDYKITNHGKLLNNMIDQLLTKFGY